MFLRFFYLIVFLTIATPCHAKKDYILLDTECSEALTTLIKHCAAKSFTNKPIKQKPFILVTPVFNAIATIQDIMVFFTGMISQTSLGEFMFVASHELGHLRYSHITMPRKPTPLLLLALPLLVATGASSLAIIAAQHLSITESLKHSRFCESQADEHALGVFFQNNWPLNGPIEFLQNDVLKDSTLYPYFRTHPMGLFRLSGARHFIKQRAEQNNLRLIALVETSLKDILARKDKCPMKALLEVIKSHFPLFLTEQEQKALQKFLAQTASDPAPERAVAAADILRQTRKQQTNDDSLLPSSQKAPFFPQEVIQKHKLLKDKVSALTTPSKFLRLCPKNPQGVDLYLLAWAQNTSHMPKQALESLSKLDAQTLQAHAPFIAELKARIFLSLGDISQAKEHARQAYEMRPKSFESLTVLASTILSASPQNTDADITEVLQALDGMDKKAYQFLEDHFWDLKAKCYGRLKKTILSRYCMLEKAYAAHDRTVLGILTYFKQPDVRASKDFKSIELAVSDIEAAVRKRGGHFV